MARIVEGVKRNIIGSNLRRLRSQRNMSQQDVSDRLERMAIYVCRGSISRIEEKQRTVTDLELYGLAKVLGVPMDDLLETEYLPE